MKLTYDQIRSVAVGAIRDEETSDGLRFYKATPRQIEAWSIIDKGQGKNAAGTAGIRLDFHTNSQHLKFSASCGSRFELLINNVLVGQYQGEELRKVSVDLTDPLGEPQEEVRVTLYFPNLCGGGVLRSVELDDGSYIRRHTFDRKILFLGDSITQGALAAFDSLCYVSRVSRFYNAESVNQGVGGGGFAPTTLDHIPFSPDVILVSFGTNDFRHCPGLEELRQRASAYLSWLAEEYRGKQFFVISPTWRGNHTEGRGMTFAQCRALIAEEAERLGMIHVDGLKLIPPLPAFFGDGYLHPNDNGFSLYAENLIAEMEKYLRA